MSTFSSEEVTLAIALREACGNPQQSTPPTAATWTAIRIEGSLPASLRSLIQRLVEQAGATLIEETGTKLPTDEDRVLAFIRDAGREVTAPEIATALGMNPGSVRVYCSRLTTSGKIVRRREPIDRRYTRALYRLVCS